MLRDWRYQQIGNWLKFDRMLSAKECQDCRMKLFQDTIIAISTSMKVSPLPLCKCIWTYRNVRNGHIGCWMSIIMYGFWVKGLHNFGGISVLNCWFVVERGNPKQHSPDKNYSTPDRNIFQRGAETAKGIISVLMEAFVCIRYILHSLRFNFF